MIQLETDRLLLRAFQPEDYPHLFELNQDPLVTRYTGDGPFENLEATTSFFADYAERQYKPYGTGRLATIEKTTGDFLGWCGLKTLEDGQVDLGYRFFQKYWGNGYATEASLPCLRYGFDVLHLSEIIATAMSENEASIHVMQKLGMRYLCDQPCGGQPGVVYRLTRDEYLKPIQHRHLHGRDDTLYLPAE